MLFSGHQAVILFFVLSGFVLTLPALRGRQPAYPTFVLKRVLRIYVPYLGALLLALLGDRLFHGSTRAFSPAASEWTNYTAGWANLTWTEPITPRLILNHLGFIGNYHWASINTAFWSLIYEMRISLIFPLITFIVLRLRAGWVILIALLCTVAGFPLATLAAHLGFADSSGAFQFQLFRTIHYIAIFLIGSLLAANLHHIHLWYERANRWLIGLVILAAIILYDGRHIAPLLALLHFHNIGARLFFPDQALDWAPALGSALLIVLAIHLKPLRNVLQSRLIHHLGKVSYSLYLVHGTVLFTLMHLLPQTISLWTLVPTYLVATLLITEIFYRIVEIPSIHLGKRVGIRARREALAAQLPASGV